MDIACALNFSWWVFHERPTCSLPARAARDLKPGGVLVLNAFGGAKAERTLSSARASRDEHARRPDAAAVHVRLGQKSFNAIDRRLLAYIHFEFKDAPPDGAGVRVTTGACGRCASFRNA